MRLKKLEISGFKSFAHKTDLEFPVTISAIVGPNGSGKSNVADAVRWVLGEQSFKNLRSKSGADLIWTGSATKSAQGKASVNLHFDNKDGFFPIDFEEVIIGRKVYSDGVNEYYLNGSQVRLKDVVELLARSKLGLRGHSIVNQGSADEILKSNPEERRGILEEALGLREFQLKKFEAEAKLTETGDNLLKTQGLLNEIFPHLRSLKRQVDKFNKREFLINDLNNFENKFFKSKVFEILNNKNRNKDAREALESKVALVRENFENKEKIFENRITSVSETGEKTKKFEAELERINIERHNITRELGRIEGLIESAKKNNAKTAKTLEAVLAIKIKYWGKRLGALSELGDLASIKEIIGALANEIKTVSGYFEKNDTGRILAMVDFAEIYDSVEDKNLFGREKEELRTKLVRLENEMAVARDSISKIRSEENKWRENYLVFQKELELARRNYFSAEQAVRDFNLEDEKIKLRESDIKSEMWGSGKNYEEFIATFTAVGFIPPEAEIITELQNKIIKLRREISDIGNVDDEVLKEYEQTSQRHGFLTAEVSDLNRATESLKNLIGDLTFRIDNDFKTGLMRINEEFNHYFRLMFGGGSAKLTVLGSSNGETGVDISISIPQKRIKDLNLLSGGERSLVSIALLFAIVSASKPPFLVLDEVDAALDEVNAARFSKVLKDLAKGTQFVLITHNRATMEAAKVLYGITMDGDGVSKLFSLKLEEAVS